MHQRICTEGLLELFGNGASCCIFNTETSTECLGIYRVVVMIRVEIRVFFEQLKGTKLLMARLRYAACLRVSELIRLRIKDLDFERNQVIVRSGKGDKDRVAPLSECLVNDLREHLNRVQQIFESDLLNSKLSGVYLPEALARKNKNAGKD